MSRSGMSESGMSDHGKESESSGRENIPNKDPASDGKFSDFKGKQGMTLMNREVQSTTGPSAVSTPRPGKSTLLSTPAVC